MIGNISKLMATALAIVAFALTPSAAMAQSFSGSYALTETHVQFGFGNSSYCLTLTDNGTLGFPHSGPATVTGESVGSVSGDFEVINNILVATFTISGDEGETAGLVFVGRASNGNIGNGFAEDVSGAENIAGELAFGAKNSCTNPQ
jgi:hypothetical protein